MSEAALPDQIERLDQALEILVRLHVAGVQHELVVQLIALADADDLFLARFDAEALVVRIVDDVDLLRRRVDEPKDVALGAFRHRQYARRPMRGQRDRRARVRIGQLVRQVLRKHQMNAVVDRHDRPARDERRQHVVWRVKERDPFTPERKRDPELLGD